MGEGIELRSCFPKLPTEGQCMTFISLRRERIRWSGWQALSRTADSSQIGHPSDSMKGCV
jgi:hypothetical protein